MSDQNTTGPAVAPWNLKADAELPATAGAAATDAPADPAVTEAPLTPAAPVVAKPAKKSVAAAIIEEVRAVEGEFIEMITVTVPKAFKLRLDHAGEVQIKAGVQEMQKDRAEHWYSVANGVTPYKK